MTDLEMTRLCAEAMKVRLDNYGGWYSDDACWHPGAYDPLHDDAQAMALVKKLRLHICPHINGWSVWPHSKLLDDEDYVDADLNRAIVTCVAHLHAAQAGK